MTAHEQSDEWLMYRVAQGSRDQLEILVRRYATPMMTFLRRMVFDADRSEELFQEVFLAVWKNRGRYVHPLPVRPWIYQIAVNKCHEDGRKRRRWPGGGMDQLTELVAADLPGPPDAAVAAETATLVIEAVNRLSVTQRAVLVMRIWSELPFAEIGESLGCTSGTARSHMHHALAAVRKFLEPRMRTFE